MARFLKPLSIKSRATLIATASFVLLFILISAIQMYFFKTGTEQVLETQQLTLVTRVADDIEQKLLLRLNALAAVADILPPEELGHPSLLQKNLENRAGLQTLFNSVAVISASGEFVAAVPYDKRRAALNVSDSLWLKELVAHARPIISDPIRSRLTGEPLVVLAAPIVDSHGKVVGALTGALNLFLPNFLGNIGEARVGKSGSFALFTRSRLIVMSSDKRRIMTQGPAPGVSPYFDHATAGGEGAEENINSRGLHALFSYKPLRSVPWVLVAALPADEAYAPIAATQTKILEVTLVLALLLAPLIWVGARILLNPLLALHDSIRGIRESPGQMSEVAIKRHDEIGELTADFNALMRERNQAEHDLKLASEEIKEREARLQAFMDHSPSLMFVKDLEGRYLHLNEQFARCFGLERTAILSRTDAELFPPDQAAQFRSNDSAVLAAGKSIETEETARYDDGLHTSIVCKFPIRDASGQLTAIGGVATDITERIWAAKALKVSEDRLRAISDNMPAMIGYIDREKRYQFNNKTYEDWLGVSRAEITGRKVCDVVGEELFSVLEPHIDTALTGQKVTFDSELDRDGRHRHLRTTYVPDVGPENEIRGIYGLINDITALKLAEKELVRLAGYDSLTGLPNRTTFNDRFGQAMARARRNRQTFGLVYLDLDRFKSVNDKYGHAIGDAVLKEFSRRLTGCVRATDTVARLSGDEFVIILEGLNRPDNAEQVAEKILAAMGPMLQLGKYQIPLATSVGIALWDEEDTDAEELIRRADAAMYRAKRSGRNSYQFYAAAEEHG